MPLPWLRIIDGVLGATDVDDGCGDSSPRRAAGGAGSKRVSLASSCRR